MNNNDKIAKNVIKRLDKEDNIGRNIIQRLDPVPVLVDDWNPLPEDMLFKSVNKRIILPVGKLFRVNGDTTAIDSFIVSSKRCYNKQPMRDHLVKYLNYFSKYYDQEGQLYSTMCHIKYLMDYEPFYSKEALINDIRRYIVYNREMHCKIYRMNEDNYQTDLRVKEGKSVVSLQYVNKHGKLLMQMSLLMNMVIPLICHYIYTRNIDHVDDTLLEVFDDIIYLSDVDMYGKFYETANNEILNNARIHSTLWSMQDVRGKDTVTHSEVCIENIILNIMPKYTYEKNIISYNSVSIRLCNRYKITDIKYEYAFTLLSSSNRDEDFNSDFDKFESYMIKQNEALYLQNKVNADKTMESLEMMFGKVSDEEIQFYTDRLSEDGTSIVNEFQKGLVFNLFYQYFGDVNSIRAIDNQISYIKLIIFAKRMLEGYGMCALPAIIGGKVIRVPNKKSINKREESKINSSPQWKVICDIYRHNPKILTDIKNKIAILLAGEFKAIDPKNSEIDNTVIPVYETVISDFIIEEYLVYVTMIL